MRKLMQGNTPIMDQLIQEIIEYLDPYKSYSKILGFENKEIRIQDFKVPVKNKLFLFGIGKSASFEVKALKNLCLENGVEQEMLKCFSLTKEGHTVKDSFQQWEGTHPLVSQRNIENSKSLIQELNHVSSEDSLIFLISGGTSALFEIPRDDLSIDDFIQEHLEILNSGKNINEMNRRRKQLSKVKGGGLLSKIKTKHCFQLITCDVPNENLSDVGSGPLFGENELVRAFKVNSASLLLDKLCSNEDRINDGVFDGRIEEFLKLYSNKEFEPGKIYISGGEATIEVSDHAGLGGRNTHMVLALAEILYQKVENRNLKIASIGTDGSDGPTDAAGAYIDYNLFQKLEGAKYLESYDSYHYFKQLGTLIKTGPTKTNVMDIRFVWRDDT